ncbi:MAG: NAD(P)-binding protein [Pseudomonadota bacterium]
MSPPKSSKMRRIAVVGSGAAGLCATWSLANTHSVTLFEQAPRWGGHANTVDIRDSHGESVAVDTGFIVYNEQNYPEISALFRRLGVAVSDSDMSFGVSLDDGRLEYSGATLNAMFAQRQNFFRPRFWQMLSDIKRFYSNAPSYLSSSRHRAPRSANCLPITATANASSTTISFRCRRPFGPAPSKTSWPTLPMPLSASSITTDC